jgi:hypothetical protein
MVPPAGYIHVAICCLTMTRSSEMLVSIPETMWFHQAEDHNLNFCQCENFRSHRNVIIGRAKVTIIFYELE